jgi:hypothetical protein
MLSSAGRDQIEADLDERSNDSPVVTKASHLRYPRRSQLASVVSSLLLLYNFDAGNRLPSAVALLSRALCFSEHFHQLF